MKSWRNPLNPLIVHAKTNLPKNFTKFQKIDTISDRGGPYNKIPFLPSKDSDNATCIIETGRASVTCSTSGSSITVDKCVFPGLKFSFEHIIQLIIYFIGVADTGLTLMDPNCFAVDHNNSTQWLIESGTVDGCGAALNYTDPEFIFQVY